jgi:glycosyltransferase involved in cell wall biosynthesis
MAKVSICIPSYNNRSSLKRCLDSIVIQTFTDYEIIVSDDSPSDDIRELVAEYKELPVIYHKNETPLGSPENWNNTLRLASGEYIKIMHNDDFFSSSNALQLFVDSLEKHPEADFGFSAYKCIDEKHESNRIQSTRFELKNLRKNPDVLSLYNFIGPPSTTIFRNKPDFYFDPNLIWVVDLEFYIRYLRKCAHFVYIPNALIFIGISETQITKQCLKDKQLRRSENKYLIKKLNIKYDCFYYAYHFIKNDIPLKYRYLLFLIRTKWLKKSK